MVQLLESNKVIRIIIMIIIMIIIETEGDEFPSSHIDTSGLPKSHAIAIRQRMHTLRTTIRYCDSGCGIDGCGLVLQIKAWLRKEKRFGTC